METGVEVWKARREGNNGGHIWLEKNCFVPRVYLSSTSVSDSHRKQNQKSKKKNRKRGNIFSKNYTIQ